jgi:hypothetical protein
MIEAASDWIGEDARAQRPRQALPTSPAMQRAVVEEQYNPWQGWPAQSGAGQQMGVAYPQPVMYPQAYPQMYPQAVPVQQPYVQASQYMMPAPAPAPQQQKQAPRVAMPTPRSVPSTPPYQKPVRKAHTAAPPPSERSEPRAAPAKPRAPKHVHRVRETNYVHIVDAYPPIVQEPINAKKAAAKAAAKSARPPSPARSSTSTESAEEVPRTSIPQAAPRFDATAFQLPLWGGPANVPRQGNGNGNEQAR